MCMFDFLRKKKPDRALRDSGELSLADLRNLCEEITQVVDYAIINVMEDPAEEIASARDLLDSIEKTVKVRTAVEKLKECLVGAGRVLAEEISIIRRSLFRRAC